MDHGPHLIVLRGNSASGKSTVASQLQRNLGVGTANIGQDHFRRVVLREHDVANGDNIDLLANTIRHCARVGYNVIVEGILVASHYRDMLFRVIAEHAGPSHVFYLELSLDEALRRHQERPLGMEVPPGEFRSWYVPSDLLGMTGEAVLDATADVRVTVGARRSGVHREGPPSLPVMECRSDRDPLGSGPVGNAWVSRRLMTRSHSTAPARIRSW